MLSWLTMRNEMSLPQEQVRGSLWRPSWFRTATTTAAVDLHTVAYAEVEIDRARRYQRALTVARFGGPLRMPHLGETRRFVHTPGGRHGDRMSLDEPGTLVRAIADVLLGTVRQCDVVAADPDQGHCLVVMPETDDEKATQAVQRLHEACLAHVMLPLHVGVATFPRDGLTLEELVRHASESPLIAVEGATAP